MRMNKIVEIGCKPPATQLEGITPEQQLDYWHALITETAAAEFLQLSIRTLQGMRQKGGSPRFVRISNRAVRYRRVDLSTWAEIRLKTSTWEE